MSPKKTFSIIQFFLVSTLLVLHSGASFAWEPGDKLMMMEGLHTKDSGVLSFLSDIVLGTDNHLGCYAVMGTILEVEKVKKDHLETKIVSNYSFGETYCAPGTEIDIPIETADLWVELKKDAEREASRGYTRRAHARTDLEHLQNLQTVEGTIERAERWQILDHMVEIFGQGIPEGYEWKAGDAVLVSKQQWIKSQEGSCTVQRGDFLRVVFVDGNFLEVETIGKMGNWASCPNRFRFSMFRAEADRQTAKLAQSMAETGKYPGWYYAERIMAGDPYIPEGVDESLIGRIVQPKQLKWADLFEPDQTQFSCKLFPRDVLRIEGYVGVNYFFLVKESSRIGPRGCLRGSMFIMPVENLGLTYILQPVSSKFQF